MTGYRRQLRDAGRAARRALIDLRAAIGDCLGVRKAAGLATLRALGLRQYRVDAGDQHIPACNGGRALVSRRARIHHGRDYHAAARTALGSTVRRWLG
jgi:hypothetical protein